jgi:hypothetical protein
MINNENKITRLLGKLEGKVDGINQRLDRMNGSIIRHEDRINSNEHNIDIITGKATILGAVFGFIGAVIIGLLNFFG